jgi:predicted peroxiredoxin
MSNKPTGAMGAGDYGKLMNGAGRGNPPRYTHLTHAEAWAKIDAENAEFKKAQDNAIIEKKVAERLKTMGVDKPKLNAFEGSEMTTVIQTLSTLGDLEQASADGIVLYIKDVKVLVTKA